MNNTNSLTLVIHSPQPLTDCPAPAFDESTAFRLSDLDETEKALCEEVRLLMIDDTKRSQAMKASKAEQKHIRLALGARLFKLKEGICKPRSQRRLVWFPWSGGNPEENCRPLYRSLSARHRRQAESGHWPDSRLTGGVG